MSIEKRLTRIETSLRPLEAVLLWLAEVQPLDIHTFWAKLAKCPPHEDPRVRIPEMVAKAVRESIDQQMMTPAEASNAVFQAVRQTTFLFRLVVNLHDLESRCWLDGQCVLVLDGFRRLLQEYRQFPECPAPLVKILADTVEFNEAVNADFLGDLSVSDALGCLLLVREIAAAISKQFFDGHRVLVAGAERRLNECIQELQCLALAGKEPSSAAADLATLESSIKPDVPHRVEALVVRTDAEVLEFLGQREAASKLRRQHDEKVAERCIAEYARRAGIT